MPRSKYKELFVDTEKKAAAFRQIWIVFGLLAVLTGIEYVIGSNSGSTALLFIIGLAKAGLIVQFYMHVYRLWREEGH